MALSLGGQFKLDVRIDGQPYDFSGSFFNRLDIFESVAEMVPTFKLQLLDDGKLTDVLPIHDGSLVEFALEPEARKTDEEPADYMPFRVWGTEQGGGSETLGTYLKIVGYYDVPGLFKDASFFSMRGNSSDVVQEIAKRSSLQFDGNPSVDSQMWYAHGITGGAFLKEITRAAYATPSSAYVNAVTRTGDLLYHDVSRRMSQPPKWKFVEKDRIDRNTVMAQDEIWVREPTVFDYAGLMNRWRGYGVYSSFFDPVTGTSPDVTVDQFPKSVDHLNINSDLANPSRYESLPINSGNAHPNYHRALVQNLTLLSSYSFNVRHQVPFTRDLRLLDRIKVIGQNKRSRQMKTATAGDYFLDRIVTVITKNGLSQITNCVREGLNSREDIPELL